MRLVDAAALTSLATALEAGLAPGALVHDPALGSALPPPARAALKKSLDTGTPLGDALLAAGLLDEGGAAILAAGERGGFLPRALRLVATGIDEERARRRRALMVLAYPAFVLVAASFLLPLPLIVTRGIGAWLATALPGASAVAALLVTGFVILPRAPADTRARLSSTLAHAPVLGAVVVDTARAALLDVLAALLSAGVPATVALPIAVRASGLSSWGGRIPTLQRALHDGQTLAAALALTGALDPAATARVALAERTGTFDAALPGLAAEARDRSRRRFALFAVAAGVCCFLAVAVAVGVGVVRGAQGYLQQIDQAATE